MVETDLTPAVTDELAIVLVEPDRASGLAELLQQYLTQSLAATPCKVEVATRLRGEVVFQAREIDDVSVRIAFTGRAVELRDGDGAAGEVRVRADFLSLAHLATGQASPLWLTATRRIELACPAGRLPFLLRVLGLLRLEDPAAICRRRRRRGIAVVVVVVAAVAAVAAWLFCGGGR